MTLIVNDKRPWQSSPVKVRFSDNMHQIGNQASEFGGSKAADAFEHAAGWIGKLPAHGANPVRSADGDGAWRTDATAVCVHRSLL